MGTVTEVFATDRRIVGITLQTPFTDEEYQAALARVRAVVEREGGADNAKITIEQRKEERPGWLDIKATWDGFIAPAAEKHRVWHDPEAEYGRERVIKNKLKDLLKDLDGVSRARVEQVIDWMEID